MRKARASVEDLLTPIWQLTSTWHNTFTFSQKFFEILCNLSSRCRQYEVQIFCSGSKVRLNCGSWRVPHAKSLKQQCPLIRYLVTVIYLIVDARTLVVRRGEVNKTPLTPRAFCCVQHCCDSNFLQNKSSLQARLQALNQIDTCKNLTFLAEAASPMKSPGSTYDPSESGLTPLF